MKLRSLICALLMCAAVPGAFAVNTLTENFTGPSLTTFSIASAGTFNGSGQYVMSGSNYIYRHVNTGDFSMQLTYSAIDMGTPTTGYNAWNYLINHKGDNTQNLVIVIFKDSAGIQFFVDKTISGVGERVYTEALTSLMSATIKVEWNEAAMQYTISAAFNGGAMTQKAQPTGFTASEFNRHEYIYGARTDAEAGKPVMTLDQYVMTAGATPLGQIDSMDSLVNWLDTGTQVSLDSTTKHEGTAAMMIDYTVAGWGWDVAPYRSQQFNFNYASPTELTFWQKSARTGKERVNQVILVDTDGHAARYSCSMPANSDWVKVHCPLSSFVVDGGLSFNKASIRSIQFWVTSWDQQGSYVWIDDVAVEAIAVAPKPPLQISAMDNIAADGWADTRDTGLMVQDTATVKQGAGSMKIAYPGPLGVYDVVPSKVLAPAIDFNDYQKQSISMWVWGDMVGDSRVNQIIVYDDLGHTGRYLVPSAIAAGWRQIIMPCKSFAWEVSAGGAPIDSSLVNWHAIGKIDIWVTSYPVPGNAVYIDDIQAMNYVPPVPSQAFVMDAAKATITVDGIASDWAALTDSTETDFDLKTTPVQPNGDLHVKYKMAWDENYLYVLVQEVPGDLLATEALGLDTVSGLNDASGGDVYYDNLAMYFDFTKTHHPGNAADIALWLICGLSSTNRTDMMMAWTNGGWGPHKPAAIANGACATSGTLGHRVFEAKVKWSDLAAEIEAARLPAGGLLSAIKPGYVFGCDPRLDDLEGAWATTAQAGAAWLNGNLWTNLPSGKDIYSTDVRLICKAADITGDCKVDFIDFAKFASQWLVSGCSDINGYCNGADIVMDNAVNMTDLGKFAQEWLK